MTEYAKLVVSVDSTQVGRAGTALGQLEKSSRRTEQSIGNLGGVVRSVAAPLAAFLSVRAVIRASDEYGQMASRIRNATSSTEEYETVQARLLETANGTYRALSEAQEVYLSTADTLRDLGYATSEVLDITDSFSYALVRDAARADQATSAMDAYSKALMKGKVDADAFATILAATPSIVNGISEATGRSTEEIRKLGATGKLSVEALNEGLRRSRDENKAFADEMETSVKDALVNLETQFGVFIGRVNETSGASGGLVDSIGELSAILADPATVEAAQQLAGGIVSAFNAIASGVKGTVEVVRWAAEEMAATFHGAASDDIVRLEDQLQTYQDMLANPLKRLRIGGDNQAIKLFDEEEIKANIAATQRQIDEFWKSARTPPPVPASGGPEAVIKDSAAMVSAVVQDTKTADAAIKKLTSSYDSIEKSLSRQLALYGQTGEVASLRFELENGELKGIVGQQAEYLIGLARELDTKRDLTEQEQLRIDILRESGQLRAANDAQFQLEYAAKIAEYERQGNVEALQRLETLRRIREVQMNADQAPGTVEGVMQAPGTRGVDAVVSGPSGELMVLEQDAVALEQWRATELEKHRGFLEAKAITEQEYLIREQNVYQQHQNRIAEIEAARQQVQLAAGEAFFSNMAGLTEVFAGEQSSAYKAMFAIEKGYALAKVLMNAPKTASDAYSAMAGIPYIGPALGVAAAAAALSYQAAQASGIRSIGLSGMAHDGIDSIPSEGTWLLDKGERVVDRRTNADLKDYLSGKGSGEGPKAGGMTVNQNFNVASDVSPQAIQMMTDMSRQVLEQVMRDANQNGPIIQTIRRRM
ncbi:tape measure protein [Pseudomonas sp. KSR10]|uniref:tape measure protein n=1 Tax=Pseudomonas sp. KSR10 TaxID=2916654 RepID=UPI001EF97262|nr:tape measure protein [Pseudomonas sp. KSR10]MCG6540164.1 tape measure protein [Pseudomonas sp. KSR10]